MRDGNLSHVFITEQDTQFAKTIHLIYPTRRELTAVALNGTPLNKQETDELFHSVDCPYCDVNPGEPCITRTGRPAEPHTRRILRLLAVLHALINQNIIHEEEHIEDLLTPN